ncbi:MAG TPA: MFS transporter [Polyangia bacterium]|nr:MFS transporter [Polyangia bacterium]
MASRKQRALHFVLLVGAMSFFADFTYEGARGIAGPYLALLGASGLAVGAVSGLGELLGYGLRLVSGRLADRTRQFWPITIAGYVVQMAAVPALALTGSWPAAAALLVLERVGKATRNPPRDVMLSHAGQEMGGYGWAFGLHEALDQAGALAGPLVMAAILAGRHGYRTAFAALGIPALCTLALLAVARARYPRPEDLAPARREISAEGLPRRFWIYLAATALVGAGFADFPLIAYHFQKASVMAAEWTPVLYAVAMGVGGAGSLLFGRLFDRHGLGVLVPLTLVSAIYAPLAFLFPHAWAAVGGVVVWGMAMGVHESIVAAAVATMVPAARRASAYGLFTAAYGVAWFLGSLALGALYDRSRFALIVVASALELAAVPLLIVVARHDGGARSSR